MFLAGLIVASSAVYTGITSHTKRRRKKRLASFLTVQPPLKPPPSTSFLSGLSTRRQQQLQAFSSAPDKAVMSETEKEVQRYLTISAASLGVAAVGGLGLPALGLLSVPGVIYVGSEFFKRAYTALVNDRKATIDLLIVILDVVSLLNGYFFLCNLNIFLAMCSVKLRTIIQDDSRHQVIDIFRQHPHVVWVLLDGDEIELPFDALKPGDTVVVHAGETIPVDGAISMGTALVDQHLLTGESQPVEKAVGDPVYALTVVLSGDLHIRVEKTGHDTTATHIGQLLNQTVNVKTQRQLWAEAIGDRAVLPTLLLGGAVMPIVGAPGALALLNSHPKQKMTGTTYIVAC